MSAALPVVLDRTVLRAFARADAAAFHAYRSDEVLARYQGWSPMDAAAASAFVESMCGVTALVPDDWIQLAIAALPSGTPVADPSADALVGDVGLHWQPARQRVDIGFTLARHAQGQGHASRAVWAAMRWCGAAGVRTMWAMTDARNTACIAVLKRTGFDFVSAQEAVFKGETCVEHVFRRDVPPLASANA